MFRSHLFRPSRWAVMVVRTLWTPWPTTERALRLLPWAMGLLVVVVVFPAPAMASVPSPCPAEAQQVGICLGFVEIPGLDRHEAALAGALMRGERDKAQRFFDAMKNEVSPAQRRRMGEALGAGQSDYEAAGSLLGQAVPVLPRSSRSFGPTAAQDARGNCCATDAWRWELSPKEWPYGHCSPGEGCPTTGWLTVDMVANIFFFPDVSYGHFFRDASGSHVRMDSMSVVIRRDRSGGPDPTIARYDCPAGDLPLSCQTATRRSGTDPGQYYYVATTFRGTPVGQPSWSFEYQTRRWKVGGGLDADFPAHSNGG